MLLPVLFYHMVLGYLQPSDVQGKMPTQDGRPVVVTGKGGDVRVNDNRIVCAYTAHGAYIYMIDTVLTPPTAGTEAGTTTSATSAASTTATSAPATTSAAATETASPAPSTSAAPTTPAATETPAAPATTTPKAAA